MYFSVLRVPRSNVYSLANTWWEGCDSFGGKCKEGYKFRLLGSNVYAQGGNSRRWSRRPITTTGEGRSRNNLSSTANVKHGIFGEIVHTRRSELTINRTDSGEPQQIQHADVRQLIADNSDLISLATFIVFDLETTGFSRNDERIIEIALQDLLGGENSTFHTLVNPERAVLNDFVHNIRTDMVNRDDVPRMHELIPVLLKYVRSRQKPGGYVVLVAHNARTFDVPFLVTEFKRCSVEIPSNWLFLDTLPLAREAMKSGGMKMKAGARISLQALREHYGIELVGTAHRALSDVRSLSLVLQKITFDLKLPIAGLVQKTFTASELNVSNAKKKKDSS